MTTAPAHPSDAPARPQTLGTIVKAEIARLLGAGGARPWLGVATAFAVIMSVLTVVLSNVAEVQELAQFDVAGLASSGPMLVLVVLALGVTSQTAREIADGTVLTSKSLVPRSRLLFVGRVSAWASITAVLGAALCLASLALALLPSGLQGSTPGATAGAVATSLLLSVLVVVLVHSGTALLQRGAVIVFVGMLVLVVLPVAFGIAGSLIDGPLASAVMMISRALPGSLLFTALQPPMSAPEISWSAWVVSVLGVLAWSAVTSLLAFRAFKKSGYGDH